MFKDEYQAVCSAGAGKSNLLKTNPLGYVVSSLVAGMFISFGSFVAFVLGSVISAGDAASWTKAVQAFAFSSALSLVVMAGAELFTGNNFVMSAAAFRKKVTWAETVKLWIVCWIGNWIGSLICVAAFKLTGIPTGDTGAYFATIAEGKVGLAPVNLLIRAILCNILVCLAVWCGTKMKTESGKLIMIFWCIFFMPSFSRNIQLSRGKLSFSLFRTAPIPQTVSWKIWKRNPSRSSAPPDRRSRDPLPRPPRWCRRADGRVSRD